MTPLQSWLLLIAVVATVTVAIIIIWSIIDAILFAFELRRVRRAAARRAPFRQAHRVDPGSARWVSRQPGYLHPDERNHR